MKTRLSVLTAAPGARGRLAWVAVVILGLVHGSGIWLGMGGWQGLTQPWPLAMNDHPLHLYGARVLARSLRQTGFFAAYDPSFMAGYAISSISNTSTVPAALFLGLFGSRDPVVAYKVYVALAAALAPWLLAAAGGIWRLGPGAIATAVLLYLIYVWTDFPLRYVEFGMVAFFMAVPLALLATAALTEYLERGGSGRWLFAAAALAVLVLVHVTAPLVVGPAALAAYALAVWRARAGGPAFPWSRHLGFWLIPLVVLAVNAFWWLPALWLVATKGGWDPAFTHPEPVLGRLWQIVTDQPPIQTILWAGVPAGLAILARHGKVAAMGLGAFVAAGLFWGYLAGASRALDPFQPGRQTYALYSAAALLCGIAAAEVFERLRQAGPARLDLWLGLGVVLVGLRLFGPSLAALTAARLRGPAPFLSSRPAPRFRWILDAVKRHVSPGERLLYEEGGVSVPGFPDVFQGDRYSGLLPDMTRVEVLGGPFLRVLVKENFTQFGEGKLFEAAGWGRDQFVRYARLYRPAAILCWSRHARAFCRGNPDLVEIVEDDGLLLLGRVKGFEGFAIEGTAEVKAEPGRIEITRASAGLDGTVVLRYHSVPCLRPRPQVAWDSVYLERDPVPFLRLRPPLGPVVFELAFPPVPHSDAARRP